MKRKVKRNEYSKQVNEQYKKRKEEEFSYSGAFSVAMTSKSFPAAFASAMLSRTERDFVQTRTASPLWMQSSTCPEMEIESSSSSLSSPLRSA